MRWGMNGENKKRTIAQIVWNRNIQKTMILLFSAPVNYGPMIGRAITYDFGLDDSNQEDTVWFIAK